MGDWAQDAYRRLVAEPYRTKVVERIYLPDRPARERILRDAFYSPAWVDSADVYIDLATDSGTGAMSDRQWAAMMRGDEAYVRSRSFLAFEDAVREVTGFSHVVPTHQGRAAENIVMSLLVSPGDIVLSNTHFDTTKAHVEHRGATAVDLVTDELWTFDEQRPFKGNADLDKLRAALEHHGDRVALVVMTVLNNFAGSSPVSMSNLRQVRELARAHGIPVWIDAARMAENAWFIKQREPGFSDRSVASIVREMMSHADGCWMSAKKDALVNIGGFIALDESTLARSCQEKLVLFEGFYTYGGLARRDLEAIAVGLREGLDESHLAHRTELVAYLGEQIERGGVVVSKPVGGSGVFVDVQSLYPHLRPDALPGIALFCDFYLEGGIRAGAAAFGMQTIDPTTGELTDRVFEVARFAVPRRVYSRAHMEYVGEVAARVKARAADNPGYRVVEMPAVLGHFFAKFAPRVGP